MYIYNVTVSIDKEIAQEWLNWMKSKHIPDVLATGCFTSNQIIKVLSDDEGATFSIQYFFNEMNDYDRYRQQFAPPLQKEHTEKYNGKFAAFRTLLQIV